MGLTDEELIYKINGCIYEVHNTLGPGLLESIYEKALVYELSNAGLAVKCQQSIPVRYKGVMIAGDLRLDILVEDRIVVELKSVERLEKVHYKQLLTYLKLLNLYRGILVNFNCDSINRDNHRVVYNSSLRTR